MKAGLSYICFLSATIIVAPTFLLSQTQNWFFGYNAGISFNTNPPSVLLGSQLSSYESCSAISNSKGVLRFYTDGIKVWNRNHVQMPNGFGLLGHGSSTQGALIIPDPGDTNKFYIFTLDQLGGANGLRYSIVDMNLQSGYGDVVSKNILVANNVTERLSAIERCDGTFWIIYHQWQSNKFFARLLTSAGLSSSVVSSSVGTVHTGNNNSVGYVKFSPKGDRLAVSILNMLRYEIFDFDITTGRVSNPITLNPTGITKAFGFEFSPDGKRFYFDDYFTGRIYQYDISSNSGTIISSSQTLVGTSASAAGGMQLGPDGKIYIARNTSNDLGQAYLGIISNPNALGVGCGFVDNGMYLGVGKSRQTLPNFYTRINGNGSITISGDTLICSGDTSLLMVSGSGNIQWVEGSSSTSPIISVTPTTTTVYKVADLSSVCKDTVSITVHVEQGAPLKITASDSVICSGDSITLNVLGAGTGTVQWSGGNLNSTQTQIKVAPITTTKYYVSGGSARCGGKDSIEIMVLPDLIAAFTQSTSLCGLEVAFESNTLGADSHLWDFGDGNSSAGSMVSHTYGSAGTYRVRLLVTNAKCGNTDTTSMLVNVNDTISPPEIYLPDVGRCQDGTIDFFTSHGTSRYQYSWDFGNGTYSDLRSPTASYQDTGFYQVILSITDTLCGEVYTDTAIVELHQLQSEIFIPNCFTPNGDGINELFMISGSQCGEGDVLEIYNRWGSRLYRTEYPYEEFWDGTFKGRQCTESVYYYLLFTNNKVYRGHLSLVR